MLVNSSTLTHPFNLLELSMTSTGGLGLLLSSNSTALEFCLLNARSLLNGSSSWWVAPSLDLRSLPAALAEVLVQNTGICHLPSESDSRWCHAPLSLSIS